VLYSPLLLGKNLPLVPGRRDSLGALSWQPCEGQLPSRSLLLEPLLLTITIISQASAGVSGLRSSTRAV